jgi:hypothetical protein
LAPAQDVRFGPEADITAALDQFFGITPSAIGLSVGTRVALLRLIIQ